MHPALRSRIRGYGYEVYMAESMEDTPENRQKYVRFIAQEVKNDGKIPHFDQSAIDEIIREAHRRSNRKGHLTLKLRDMGGLIRLPGISPGRRMLRLRLQHMLLPQKRLRGRSKTRSPMRSPGTSGNTR